MKNPMSLIREIDYGTPASTSETLVTLNVDGFDVTVPEGTSIMRASMDAGIEIPKLCATDMVEAFGSCRLCLVEIDGRNGTPSSCTTPVTPGMVVHTQTEKLKKIRRGVMELYISDHPLDCLTCAANGDCELQTQAGVVGLRSVRYNVEANHFTPKVRSIVGLRPGLPDCHADGEVGRRDRHPRAFRRHNVRLLRRRLFLQGRDARRRADSHGAVQGRQGQPWPLLRQGPLRLWLRQPSRSHHQADGPRFDRSAVARGLVGRRVRLRRRPLRLDPEDARRRLDRRHHVEPLHERGNLPRPEADPPGLRQQQRRYLRPRLPLPHGLRPRPGLRHVGRYPRL